MKPPALLPALARGSSPAEWEAFRATTKKSEALLLWVDLEMTGLDLGTDRIVELALVASDMMLESFVQGPSMVINPSVDDTSYQLTLSSWCEEVFSENGLKEEILKSECGLKEAEQSACEFVNALVRGRTCDVHFAGSSVHVDRQFLCRDMPELVDKLNHRIVDVSSFKLAARHWLPERMQRFCATTKDKNDAPANETKEDTSAPAAHRAANDIVASIELLWDIKENVFRRAASGGSVGEFLHP